MESLPVWTIWFAVSAILVISEIFTGTFFLLCFGIAAGATAFAAMAEVSLLSQWTLFAIVSAVTVALSRRFFLKFSDEPEQKVGVDRFIGRKVAVVEAIDSATGSGRVVIDGESWRAISNVPLIGASKRVVVAGVEGTKLIVEEES